MSPAPPSDPAPRRSLRAPLADRFDGFAGTRLLWLAGIAMLAFGAAELPALARMSAHGTGVVGFEFAASTHRMHEILTRWGPTGHAAARQHVFIDLGFILGYGLLLIGLCARLAGRLQREGHPRAARAAALLAWGALIAAVANALQKMVLWLELHGHIAQPLPVLAAVCATITFTLAISAALFAIGGMIALRRLPAVTVPEGQTR
ncbi:MAG TPA: hypothetical protein VNY27_11830 [Solirubrobacteraceae bacterium]|jgi:hypothetical protein|nr:hypothetical protein [Solirubrobacteraceae bacterium]